MDSGGYESTKDLDLSDTYENEYGLKSWSPEDYQEVLDQWTCESPTVFVSYDGPESKESYATQIKMAGNLRIPAGPHAKTLLLKPQSEDSRRHKMDELISACRFMDQFPVVGITEKEIGNSVLSRMSNIARLRVALDRLFDDRPIHVFGSLDTVSTFLYFLAGADIFDGLTWLRYAFVDGDTLYRHQFGMQLPVSTNSDVVEASSWTNNYRHTRTMLLQMRKYLVDGSFAHFGKHHAAIRDAFEAMKAELAGD
ncbi:MAG: hypothetical protein HY834_10110 [Devosia nanyangense]|uniref:Uncharacterized protein n=1 Tax=Devosia nanyangense TaxID=1228055 RepID=A0A933L179_9HYPH|nr:hypothetical protein [Devosia nanyangense]